MQTLTTSRRTAHGFTLIEMLVALAMAAALSSIAYPSFESQLRRAYRSDGLVALMHAQLAQERWRANSASYGSLMQAGVPVVSTAGHYQLDLLAADADGYELLATATGSQARDSNCRYLRLRVIGANVLYASGPSIAASNPATLNRGCWSL
ncbi:MAG: type IV pilin protein [Burkholderiaceae bacterium]